MDTTEKEQKAQMKITMLGTGEAVVTKCYNTCFIIDDAGRYFMVDGGGGIRYCVSSALPDMTRHRSGRFLLPISM